MENEQSLIPRDYELAHEHVEWFLSTLQPLLVSHFVHGYKHGIEDATKGTPGANRPREDPEIIKKNPCD